MSCALYKEGQLVGVSVSCKIKIRKGKEEGIINNMCFVIRRVEVIRVRRTEVVRIRTIDLKQRIKSKYV